MDEIMTPEIEKRIKTVDDLIHFEPLGVGFDEKIMLD